MNGNKPNSRWFDHALKRLKKSGRAPIFIGVKDDLRTSPERRAFARQMAKKLRGTIKDRKDIAISLTPMNNIVVGLVGRKEIGCGFAIWLEDFEHGFNAKKFLNAVKKLPFHVNAV